MFLKTTKEKKKWNKSKSVQPSGYVSCTKHEVQLQLMGVSLPKKRHLLLTQMYTWLHNAWKQREIFFSFYLPKGNRLSIPTVL